jgi:hypothetical protein
MIALRRVRLRPAWLVAVWLAAPADEPDAFSKARPILAGTCVRITERLGG